MSWLLGVDSVSCSKVRTLRPWLIGRLPRSDCGKPAIPPGPECSVWDRELDEPADGPLVVGQAAVCVHGQVRRQVGARDLGRRPPQRAPPRFPSSSAAGARAQVQRRSAAGEQRAQDRPERRGSSGARRAWPRLGRGVGLLGRDAALLDRERSRRRPRRRLDAGHAPWASVGTKPSGRWARREVRCRQRGTATTRSASRPVGGAEAAASGRVGTRFTADPARVLRATPTPGCRTPRAATPPG